MGAVQLQTLRLPVVVVTPVVVVITAIVVSIAMVISSVVVHQLSAIVITVIATIVMMPARVWVRCQPKGSCSAQESFLNILRLILHYEPYSASRLHEEPIQHLTNKFANAGCLKLFFSETSVIKIQGSKFH